MSDWILSKLLPTVQMSFQNLLAEMATSERPSIVFAQLLELIDPMRADEFESTVSEAPAVEPDPYWKNYVAATVEHAAAMKQARTPGWTRDVIPLEKPAFGSSLESLKLHLLVNSPPAFIERNIFIDSNLGDRVGGLRSALSKDDTRYLLRNLEIRRYSDAEEILGRYYSLEAFPESALAALASTRSRD